MTPVLLAHGAGGGIQANFAALIDDLSIDRTVIGPDLPGSGAAPRRPEPLALDLLADELVAAADGHDRVAIVGYSLGTALAVRAAVRHPDRVAALVLTAPFAKPTPRFTLLVKLWRELLDTDHLADFMHLVGVGAPYLDHRTPQELADSLAGAAEHVPPGTPDQLDLIDTVDIRADLAAIAVPTLVISTTHDNLVTPYHHREVAAGIEGARYAELASGHLPFVEAPTEWIGLVRGFLDSRDVV
ncbi:alpha/beta fold hydrolase [Kribbella sp. NPDC051586]|uniref:alpha/beta fold hydrolase n=1 Tax=Kribbella sp. NPDC051586 TaxID=3364118 RepID=UPI0037AC36F6